MALLAKEQNLSGIVLPMESAKEASIVKGIKIYGINTLTEAVDFLNGTNNLVPMQSRELLILN